MPSARFAPFVVLSFAVLSLHSTHAEEDGGGVFHVKFTLSQPEGQFVVEVHEDWSPIGAQRFKELVESKFYDNTRFFRVIPGFMAQFGLSGDPALNSAWRAKTIKDDPVKKSNLRGFITFAKTGRPNSRTTQLFINYGNNARLDNMGFAPFGVVMGDGMDSVDKVYNIGERPSQGSIQSRGNEYLDAEFPSLTKNCECGDCG